MCVLFPNRSLLLGFSSGSKRGLRENTHKACSGQMGGSARGRRGSLKFRRVLPQKLQKVYSFTQTENFSLERQSTFALLGAPRLQFPIGWVCSPIFFCRVIFAKSSPMFFLSSDLRQESPSKDPLNENLYNRYLQ